MSDEPDITSEELAVALGKKKRSSKPIIIGSLGLTAIVILFYVGKSLISNKTETKEDSAARTVNELPPLDLSDTAGLADLLFDTLELAGDGITEPNDTLELPIQQLTSAQVDTSEFVEIPGIDYLDKSELLNGTISSDEFQFDTSVEFELAIAASMRPETGFPSLQLWKTESDTVKPNSIDTSAILAAFGPQISQASRAEIDSLTAIANEKERALQMLASDNEALSTKLTRYKPKIDSTRAVQIKRLVKIIETMSPVAAANMLSTQSTDEITEILFRLKPKKASKILQQLPPGIASDIAVRIVRQ